MKKILVIDDDMWFIEFYEDHLGSDFEVIKAYSAKEAIPLIEDMDLVLTDWRMPGVDGGRYGGREVVEYCNKINKPVLVCSGSISPTKDAPVFSKDSDLNTLSTTINNILA